MELACLFARIFFAAQHSAQVRSLATTNAAQILPAGGVDDKEEERKRALLAPSSHGRRESALARVSRFQETSATCFSSAFFPPNVGRKETTPYTDAVTKRR